MKFFRLYLNFLTVGVMLILSKNIFAQSQQLSLEECHRLALTQNKKLKAAQYDIDAARAALKTAETNVYPSIDGSATGVYLGKPLSGALGIIPKDEILIGSVTATQPIYAGGKIKLGKQAAGKGVEICQDQKLLAESEVSLNVDKAYWQVVQVKGKIILAEKYKEMLTVLQQDLKNSFDAGLIYKNDLLRVEVNLNEAELNIAKAKDGWVLAKLNLAQIIGTADNTDFYLTDSLT
jgi:outer membrane protein